MRSLKTNAKQNSKIEMPDIAKDPEQEKNHKKPRVDSSQKVLKQKNIGRALIKNNLRKKKKTQKPKTPDIVK